jgi:hypothetical protein
LKFGTDKKAIGLYSELQQEKQAEKEYLESSIV